MWSPPRGPWFAHLCLEATRSNVWSWSCKMWKQEVWSFSETETSAPSPLDMYIFTYMSSLPIYHQLYSPNVMFGSWWQIPIWLVEAIPLAPSLHWCRSDIYLLLHLRSSSWAERWISAFMKGNFGESESFSREFTQQLLKVLWCDIQRFGKRGLSQAQRQQLPGNASGMNWNNPHTGDFPVCVTARKTKKTGMINHRVVRGPVFNLGTEQEGGKRRGMNQISRRGRREEEQKRSLVF